MTDNVVDFNFTEWLLAYPEFGGITEQTATAMFHRATLFIDNRPNSIIGPNPVCNSAGQVIADLSQRKWILYMATSHMCALFATYGSVSPSPSQPPGRVSSATEGSVSSSFDYIQATSNLQAFWNQTKYGAGVYAATTQFRTAFYVLPPLRQNPIQSVFGNFLFRR